MSERDSRMARCDTSEIASAPSSIRFADLRRSLDNGEAKCTTLEHDFDQCKSSEYHIPLPGGDCVQHVRGVCCNHCQNSTRLVYIIHSTRFVVFSHNPNITIRVCVYVAHERGRGMAWMDTGRLAGVRKDCSTAVAVTVVL